MLLVFTALCYVKLSGLYLDVVPCKIVCHSCTRGVLKINVCQSYESMTHLNETNVLRVSLKYLINSKN